LEICLPLHWLPSKLKYLWTSFTIMISSTNSYVWQTYVFQGMMVNEFAERTYNCGAGCHCMYQTELASKCQISGLGVLDLYGYKTGRTGEWVGILLGIVLGYRLLGWVALVFRK
jgi:hypothetical protein